MGRFTTISDDTTQLSDVKLANATKKRLRLADVKARVAEDISVKSSKTAIVTVKLFSRPHDGPKGVWTVELEAKAVGTAAVTAEHKDSQVASVNVEVFKPVTITLDGKNTEAGMLQRLLLSESIAPGSSGYKAADVKTAMEWMIVVVENRARHPNPGRFMARDADKDGWDKKDIIRAKGQFHGFENYPTLAEDVRKRIENILKIGNDYEDSRHDAFAAHLNRAIEVSKAKLVKDPSGDGLFGWRTQGRGSPGSNFVKFKDLAGQTFYTLKKEKKKK